MYEPVTGCAEHGEVVGRDLTAAFGHVGHGHEVMRLHRAHRQVAPEGRLAVKAAAGAGQALGLFYQTGVLTKAFEG